MNRLSPRDQKEDEEKDETVARSLLQSSDHTAPEKAFYSILPQAFYPYIKHW